MSRKESLSVRQSILNKGDYKREEQILKFSPIEIIDSVINATNEYCCDIVDALELGLQKQFPKNDQYITNSCDEFLDKFEPNLEKMFNKFEKYALKNSFSVPIYINSLEENEKENDQTDSYRDKDIELELEETIEEEKLLDSDLYQLQKKILKEKYHISLLKEKLGQYPEKLDDIPTVTDSNGLLEITSCSKLVQTLTKNKNSIHKIIKNTNLDPSTASFVNPENEYLKEKQNIDMETIDKLTNNI
eukprot:TRINITY_DN12115_c0_g1_i1.p1 TRINITY_DN12115_c0_g1~~TRINITY_DN12115_c0_g1_i1.p1  ORF type:complete len:246 (-),score=62.02 TRINITY_DN12115_c0_g1_i1:97-834(-)